MDTDKIIIMLECQKNMVFSSSVDNNFKCGYELCLGDLKELIGYQRETPSCADSSDAKFKVAIDEFLSVIKDGFDAVKELDESLDKLKSVKVDKLEPTKEICCQIDCIYATVKPPTNEQLMDKINEIIDVVNKL